jgi:hypothetical protein
MGIRPAWIRPPDGFPDHGFRSFEERLKFVECLLRQIAETWSDCAKHFQVSHEDREQRSSKIHCRTAMKSPLDEIRFLMFYVAPIAIWAGRGIANKRCNLKLTWKSEAFVIQPQLKS